MNFEKGLVNADVVKTLGQVKFVRAHEARTRRDAEGADTGELLERRYDLICSQGSLTVTIPPDTELLNAKFGDNVELVNPKFKAWAIQNEGDFRAEIGVKVTADNIKLSSGTAPAQSNSTNNKEKNN